MAGRDARPTAEAAPGVVESLKGSQPGQAFTRVRNANICIGPQNIFFRTLLETVGRNDAWSLTDL